MRANRLPLKGIRVLDLTMVVAGPYCTMLLADWGAEVIRMDTTQVFVPYTRGTTPRPPKEYVEAVSGSGYGYAGNTPAERPWNRYAMFQNHARNKLSMTVDLLAEDCGKIFEDLVAISDIIVENNVPINLAKLGITYDRVRRIRPDIIMLRIPPYGLGGDYENYRAFGSHIEAVNGHLWMRGYPDTDATMRGVLPVGDGPSGVGGATAAVMALRHRARTGQGQLVEVSQTENFATYMGEALMDYSMNKRQPELLGNRSARCAPQGVYPGKGDDKWVAIAVSSDEEWRALCRVMGDPPWAQNPEYQTNAGRLRNHNELDENISQWTKDQEHYALMWRLQEAGVPAGAVIDEAEAFSDPHFNARGFFERLTHPECGAHRYPGIGFKMRRTPNHIRRAACRMGEDNEYVYEKLLVTDHEKYTKLIAEGRIGMDYAPTVR
ncbi:MAG: CoA transferase [Chloroflexi bacterium]|nr:CoA transferase [Chloroflexota bacterium]